MRHRKNLKPLYKAKKPCYNSIQVGLRFGEGSLLCAKGFILVCPSKKKAIAFAIAFFNDVCPVGQMMSAPPDDVACGNDVCLRHMGQTSHHCDQREQHHTAKGGTSFRRRRYSIERFTTSASTAWEFKSCYQTAEKSFLLSPAKNRQDIRLADFYAPEGGFSHFHSSLITLSPPNGARRRRSSRGSGRRC